MASRFLGKKTWSYDRPGFFPVMIGKILS